MASVATLDETTLNNLCYQYRYDGRNRLVEKKLPGKGWEYMVYDNADRLILTQDANLRETEKWMITKYDNFGRVIYTGLILRPNETREALQNVAKNHIIVEGRDGTGFSRNGLQIYYTNGYYYEIETVLSVNYYDSYPSGTPGFTPTLPGNTVITDNFTQNVNTKSLPVASYVKNIEDDNWTKNYTWYDNKGRVIATHSINHLGGYTKTESQLDFSGVAKHVVTRHKRLDTDVERMITENFTYDHQNRLLIHTHQVDGNDVEYLAQNEYNELSQLKSKKVGGASAGNGLQTVDYAYNIRGWMKSINNPNNLGSDLFAYKLGYETAESPLSVARFNGNISETDWIIANDGILRRYSYTYDSLNRLKTAGYQKPNSGVIDTKAYDENVTYDLNGNILTLRRFGGNDGNLALKIDDIDYTYDGNQLIDVWDSSGNFLGLDGGDAMSYDANGNIVNDWAHFISNISYNHLNLPSRIDKDVEYYEYIYSADGRKLMSFNNFFEIDQIIITAYLDGFQYNDGVLQFIPTTEGYYSFTENRYVYNYTDHLGNIRVSYTRNGSNAQILEENNYYPFGLKHTGYNSSANNSSYNYKYNGKELMTMGYYDYGARFYMPDLGRWAIVDPLSDATFQPYNYVNNNPISFIDPTGMIGEDFASIGVIKNKKGEYEIVSAKNDGDYGIYLADSKGNYNINRCQRVGTLNNSFDFLFTNDTTGKFTDVAKRDNGSNITLTSNMNLGTLLYKYGYRTNNGIEDYELDLGQLAILSANGATLDLKVSLGLDKYSPVRVGKSYTSLRAASNLLFGFNMRKIYDKYKNDKDFKNEFNNAESFYIYAMQVVGSYNQFQNNRENFMKGNGYNKGFPFYGEHAYSGYNIYRGYFHQFTNQKLHRDK